MSDNEIEALKLKLKELEEQKEKDKDKKELERLSDLYLNKAFVFHTVREGKSKNQKPSADVYRAIYVTHIGIGDIGITHSYQELYFGINTWNNHGHNGMYTSKVEKSMYLKEDMERGPVEISVDLFKQIKAIITLKSTLVTDSLKELLEGTKVVTYTSIESTYKEAEMTTDTIDYPHIKLDSFGTYTLTGLPYLIKDVYLITSNSVEAASSTITSLIYELTSGYRGAASLFSPSDIKYIEQQTNKYKELLDAINTKAKELGII